MLLLHQIRPRTGLPLCSFLIAALAGISLGQVPRPTRLQRNPGLESQLPAQQILGRGPRTPNPYLAYLPPGVAPDYEYWKLEMSYRAKQRRKAQEESARLNGLHLAASASTESEPNDSLASADQIDLGTGGDDQAAVDILGGITRRELREDPLGPYLEDDGSIDSATPLAVTADRSVRVTGTIGDGPFAITSGDFDVFRIPDLKAGWTLFVDVDTPGSNLDSIVFVLSDSGPLLAFNDQDPSGGTDDSFVAFRIPEDDTYIVYIGGSFSFLGDPFDSSSGSGAASRGNYEILIGIDLFESDFFSFDLEAGDVVGFNGLGSAGDLSLIDPSGLLRVSSAQDLSAVYPPDTPLPGGGNAVLAYVAEAAGRYALRVEGTSDGNYQVEARVFRREERSETGGAQTLFIDFDGATITGPGALGGGAVLSPLAEFLPNFGLRPEDEDAVVDAILATVEENLSQDLRESGNNGDFGHSQGLGDFEILIRNSRDHPDRFGSPNVSRVIVGGTRAQLGIATIGIAESVDVGNFRTNETAFVLLDLLSGKDGPGLVEGFARAEGFSIIDAIGIALGNIVAHEAGHLFGNFHTENIATLPNIMDQGGNVAGTFGVGPDMIFGSQDDIDVDFGPDSFVPNEGFTGIEDTLNTVAFGLSTTISNLFFPQFGNGAGLVSEILLSNPETRPAVGILRLFDSAGEPIDLGGGASGAGQFAFNGQAFDFTIPPLGSLRLMTDGSGALLAGSARVAANPPLGGAIRFEISGVGVAGVGNASPTRSAMVPVQRRGGVNTAIALQNTNSAIEAHIELTLRDIDGNVVPGGVSFLTLLPNGREALFIDEIFPDANSDNFQGSVTLTSTIPVAALALEQGASQMTTLPVIEVP